MNYVDRFDAAQGARTNRLPTGIREEWRERSPETFAEYASQYGGREMREGLGDWGRNQLRNQLRNLQPTISKPPLGGALPYTPREQPPISKPPLGALPTPSPLGLSEVRQMFKNNLSPIPYTYDYTRSPSTNMQQGPYTPRGPMTGPTIRRGTDVGVDVTPWMAGGAFEPNSTGIPWDYTHPYPTPSRIGPAVVPPRGFTGQIERGYRGYPQMQQEINPLPPWVPFRRLMPIRPPTRYPTSGMPVEGF